MSPIKLNESCNKISEKTAMLTWTGTAVLIIHGAKSIQTIAAIDSIDGKTTQKLSLLFLVHQDFKKFFALVTSLSQLSSVDRCSNIYIPVTDS